MSEFEKWWQYDNIHTNIRYNNEQYKLNHTSSRLVNDEIFIGITKLPNIFSSTLNDRIQSTKINLLNDTITTNYDTEFNWIHSTNSILLLIIIYGIVILGGVLGNASLVLTLYSAASVRLRNPLLVALCIADLLVAGISAPTTIITFTLTQKSWTLSLIGCKMIYYLQSMPIAASTLSFLMLSLDRCATVIHPRLAQLRQRRYVHAILASIAWLGANIICLPILLAYNIKNISINSTINKNYSIPTQNTIITTTTTLSSLTSSSSSEYNYQQQQQQQQQQNYLVCRPEFGSIHLQTSFILIHTFIVFLVPGIGVILNHYGVHRKLCALSLTARAAHGELPLPMPILRRPTHMIIVTGIANGRVVSDSESSSSIENKNNDNNKDKNMMMNTIIRTTSPKSPRVMREIRVQQQRQKREGKQQSLPAPSALPLPQTSTLRARRRLANMLVAAAIIFIGCWTPHVFCVLWTEFSPQKYCSKTISYFSLLLGYTHSVISPIIYWILNHNSLRQSPCAPFLRFSTIQRFLRTHWRSPAAPPPPSSTNEAALGAFHPRYIKTTPKQYRAQASSHYLY